MLFVLALLTFPDVIYSLPDDRSIILLLSAFFYPTLTETAGCDADVRQRLLPQNVVGADVV